MQLRKATRTKVKLRVGLAGPSGSGKTYSALLMARGMASDWSKIALIDTENGSGELYSNLGDYNVITLTAPFSPERYIEAIKACEAGGMEVIIIDSITHEWDGTGGCLEIVDKITQGSAAKNSYTAWGKVTPRHNAFMQAILQSTAHVLTTVRKKQDYSMDKDSSGKTIIQKVGLKEITREGFEYELTVNLELNIAHLALAGKDRTGLFMDQPEFTITQDTGKLLMAWASEGIESPADIRDKLLKSVNAAEKVEDLTKIKGELLSAGLDETIKRVIITAMIEKSTDIAAKELNTPEPPEFKDSVQVEAAKQAFQEKKQAPVNPGEEVDEPADIAPPKDAGKKWKQTPATK